MARIAGGSAFIRNRDVAEYAAAVHRVDFYYGMYLRQSGFQAWRKKG